MRKISSNFFVDRIGEVYPPFVVAGKLPARTPQMDSCQLELDRRRGKECGSFPADAIRMEWGRRLACHCPSGDSPAEHCKRVACRTMPAGSASPLLARRAESVSQPDRAARQWIRSESVRSASAIRPANPQVDLIPPASGSNTLAKPVDTCPATWSSCSGLRDRISGNLKSLFLAQPFSGPA